MLLARRDRIVGRCSAIDDVVGGTIGGDERTSIDRAKRTGVDLKLGVRVRSDPRPNPRHPALHTFTSLAHSQPTAR